MLKYTQSTFTTSIIIVWYFLIKNSFDFLFALTKKKYAPSEVSPIKSVQIGQSNGPKPLCTIDHYTMATAPGQSDLRAPNCTQYRRVGPPCISRHEIKHHIQIPCLHFNRNFLINLIADLQIYQFLTVQQKSGKAL